MTDNEKIIIDGSQGEGGGQIIRSSLALSLVTGRSFEIYNIRAGRKKPGLMRQHLTAVRAAGAIGNAQLEGDAIGSRHLKFTPGEITAGDYHFPINTAGSTTLVMQTVLPALSLASGRSTVKFEGGTHNPFAPPFHFLEKAYLPLVRSMGPGIDVRLKQYGFYPAGGGCFTLSVDPVKTLGPLELLERGKMQKQHVRAVVANLPLHIAQRECDTIAAKTDWDKSSFSAEEATNAIGHGNVMWIELESENITEVFTGCGKIGVKAEYIARDTLRTARHYIKADVPVGEYLADQLMLPMGIGAWQGTGGGRFRTLALSMHSKTHIDILRMFLDIHVEVIEHGKDNSEVVIAPAKD